MGTITGAIKGQTTETGLLCGAAIGAVAGAIAAVQLMELTVHGEPFSKVMQFFLHIFAPLNNPIKIYIIMLYKPTLRPLKVCLEIQNLGISRHARKLARISGYQIFFI